MSGLTGYLTSDGTDLSSIFMPIVGGSFYLSNFVYSTSSAPYSITSSGTQNIVSPNISIGVWQISGGVVINRNSGTFGNSSYQQLVLTLNSGSGTLSTVAMLFPITSSTMTQIVTPMVTSTFVATSESTINFALITNMATYSGTTGYITFMFTKIGDVGGGVVSLNGNNTFTGSNIFDNKINTKSGIIGPSSALAFTSDMIGRRLEVSGDGSNVATTSLTWYAANLTGFTFPSPGTWIVNMDYKSTTSNAAGYILFCNAGLSSTAAVSPTGQGSFEITIAGMSATTPNVAGYAAGSGTWTSVITSTSVPYYFNIRWQNTTTVITLLRSGCRFVMTRIA